MIRPFLPPHYMPFASPPILHISTLPSSPQGYLEFILSSALSYALFYTSYSLITENENSLSLIAPSPFHSHQI